MNKLMCVNGHFYDGDTYSSCPHCEQGMEAAKPDTFLMRHNQEYSEQPAPIKKERMGLFGKKKTKSLEENRTEYISEGTSDFSRDNDDKTEILTEDDVSFNVAYRRAMEEQEPQMISSPVVQQVKTDSISPQFNMNKNYQDLDEGKTIGFFSTGATEPPVGYLICIKGEDYGEGFLLKSGNNSIGRSQSMDVVIRDPKVSREKQAFVMYEPHKRDFYLKPGEGNGLCYLNDDILLEIKKIKAYDQIVLGDTVLMLVPVCGENFSWE